MAEKPAEILVLESRLGVELKAQSLDKIAHNNLGYHQDEHLAITGLGLEGLVNIESFDFLQIFPHLHTLKLSGTGFMEFELLEQLPSLRVLFLDRLGIKELTPLTSLKRLSQLDLYKNEIQDLSPLESLPALTKLQIEKNEIEDLSPLKSLTGLTDLILNENMIEDLSPIAYLTGLTALYLSENKINDLSPLASLPSLTRLLLDINKIEDLSPLESLEGLTYLSLRFNKIEDLSPLEPLYRKGCRIIINSNPLQRPPLEIVEQGDDAILTWFDAQRKASRPLNEVKVVLVGEGSSGKTSLMKQLLNQEFDPNEDQTHGINFAELTLRKGKEPLLARLWDFGGQEIMHATHQFFLSKRSLYIVVLDGRRDERPEYWLKHAQTFGGDSPVFVVMNKIDQNKGHDMDEAFLKTRYPAIQGFFKVSCKRRKGISSLFKAMKRTLADLEMATTIWPETWFNLKQNLERENQTYLTKSRFDQLCKEAQIFTATHRKVLVRFLNDLGVAIHFDTLNLKHTFVLQPNWVTAAVYRIINAEQLADNDGVLSLETFSQLLAKPSRSDNFSYPEEVHPYILALMKKFELCYELEGERILVPDLLPKTPPPLNLDQDGATKFRISYEFLPTSVLPRLIVRRHRQIDGQLRWRKGVVLRNKRFNSRALIQADYENRAVLGWVSGGGEQEHLTTLLEVLEDINGAFQKNRIVEQVACICERCQGVAEPHFHSLFNLFAFYLDGDRHVRCEVSTKRMPIADLLGQSIAANTAAFLDRVGQERGALRGLPEAKQKVRLEDIGNASSIGSALAWVIEAVAKVLL